MLQVGYPTATDEPSAHDLTAIHEQDTSSNVPDEDPGHAAHDLRPADSFLEAPTPGVVEDKGASTDGSPVAPAEHVSGVDDIGKDAEDAVQQARSGGKCTRRDNVPLSLTTSTCRKRLERQGNWWSWTRVRCRQGCRRSVWPSQGCA